jgi:hypothetical protein
MGDLINFNDLPDTRTPKHTFRTTQQIITETAYHEAGHAIIGMTYGMSLARLRVHTIDIDGDMGWTGTTTWNNSFVSCFNLAVELAAGEAAAQLYLIRSGSSAYAAQQIAASPHDRDMAITVAARSSYTITIDGPDPVNQATGTTWAQVTAIADQAVTEAWAQITATANALLTAPRRELTGQQVAGLTGITNPIATAPTA